MSCLVGSCLLSVGVEVVLSLARDSVGVTEALSVGLSWVSWRGTAVGSVCGACCCWSAGGVC